MATRQGLQDHPPAVPERLVLDRSHQRASVRPARLFLGVCASDAVQAGPRPSSHAPAQARPSRARKPRFQTDGGEHIDQLFRDWSHPVLCHAARDGALVRKLLRPNEDR